ncbi:unnamed protein product [Boreogadus saida]
MLQRMSVNLRFAIEYVQAIQACALDRGDKQRRQKGSRDEGFGSDSARTCSPLSPGPGQNPIFTAATHEPMTSLIALRPPLRGVVSPPWENYRGPRAQSLTARLGPVSCGGGGDRRTGNQSTGNRPTGNRPTGNRPTGNRPTGNQSGY